MLSHSDGDRLSRAVNQFPASAFRCRDYRRGGSSDNCVFVSEASKSEKGTRAPQFWETFALFLPNTIRAEARQMPPTTLAIWCLYLSSHVATVKVVTKSPNIR